MEVVSYLGKYNLVFRIRFSTQTIYANGRATFQVHNFLATKRK